MPAPGRIRPATILATGKELAYRMDGTTITFTIPADGTTPLLDVIKVQWWVKAASE
jgi:hypothetical protein